MIWGINCSTIVRMPVPNPCRRKFAAPAAMPTVKVVSQGWPAAQEAAMPPIIESPQPSGEPWSNRGGTNWTVWPSLAVA